MQKLFLFFVILLAGITQSPAQNNSKDTSNPVHIINAKSLVFKRINANTEVQVLTGNVQAQQGTTLFFCDSCIINGTAHQFEAFGHVHIKDNDTINVYSDYLKYLTNTKMAYLKGNVNLSDGHATLTTNNLDYDVANKIGTYHEGGRLVNKKTVLTSQEGIYYADLRDVYFKNNVEMKDPAYYVKTDSLLYNTQSQLVRFIAQTYIRDSTNRVIRTKEGTYDLRLGHANFTQRTSIEDGSLKVTGDRIASDDSTGIIEVDGRGVLIDTAKGINILANRIYANKKTNSFLATKKPVMIIKQEKDSIYVSADTLFSARLTDLYKNTDTLNKMKEEDSTNRYFEAFRHVRVFSDSAQATSDSLFYSFKDSIFHLYYDPVVWSRKSQITGDTIYLYTKNKKPDRFKAINNSFMVSEVQNGVYNQIKSTRMDGYFKKGEIDSVRAKGAAESIYFLQEKDSSYSGVNQTKSDMIDIYFDQGELDKVVFRTDLKGTLYPIKEKQPSEMRLPKFRWLESRRPKTKYELFE
jgi:lipopolysaccharide export system protein LptA